MTTKTGKPAGRPKKPEEEKLGQFSIRLSPKVKTGVELLARLQGRTMTQSIEWALQYAMIHVPATDRVPDPVSLWGLVERFWDTEGWERAYYLHQVNPLFVTFEERHACSLIVKSLEDQFVNALPYTDKRRSGLIEKWHAIVKWAWPELLGDAQTMRLLTLQQVSTEKRSLCCDLELALWDWEELPLDLQIEKSYEVLMKGKGLSAKSALLGDEPTAPPI